MVGNDFEGEDTMLVGDEAVFSSQTSEPVLLLP